MLNDRDDKQQGLEDGEYHFSDEEVNYDADTTSHSPETGTVPKPAAGGMMSRLSSSKRMLISLVVFIALVFVVYKMIAPVSQQAPSTEIATVNTTGTSAKPMPAPVQPVVNVAPPPIATTPQVNLETHPTPAMPQQQQPMMPQQQQPAMPQQQQPAMPQQQQPMMPQQQQPVMPQQQQPAMPQQQQPAMPQQQQPAMPQQQQPTMLPQVTTTVTTTTPSVNTTTNQEAPIMVPTGAELTKLDQQINAMAVQNEQRIKQLQSEYVAGINRYNELNQNLGEQVQTLTERVRALETEINQLTQRLMRTRADDKVSVNTTSRPVAPREPMPQTAVSAKIPYNVQAIIPGRAWLRSETGDTVTVAEGDMVRGVGRVTKIDPYDGVVQIAMGGRIVSLSYGNGD